jgi:hypothetical protein
MKDKECGTSVKILVTLTGKRFANGDTRDIGFILEPEHSVHHDEKAEDADDVDDEVDDDGVYDYDGKDYE